MSKNEYNGVPEPLTESGSLIAPLIDHTLLKPDASVDEVSRLCDEAIVYSFASVCVNPVMVAVSAASLAGQSQMTCCTIGFPLGASCTATKQFEAETAVTAGAEELDMVLSVSALKGGDREYVHSDIAAVVHAAGGLTVKVILETCLLTDNEKILACKIAVDAGVSFVKTSTGMSTGGATLHDIRLMRETVGPDIGVKASGGIKTIEDTLAMIDAGATRIGTSAGVAIVT